MDIANTRAELIRALINNNPVQDPLETSVHDITIKQNISNFIANCTDFIKNNLVATYKYIEEFEIRASIDSSAYNKFFDEMYNTPLATDANYIKTFLAKNSSILTRMLCSNEGQASIIDKALYTNNIVFLDTLLDCILQQDKLHLIAENLHEKLFIYACEHPNSNGASAIIKSYQDKSSFFDPAYIARIHNIFLKQDIIDAINAPVSIEDITNSQKLFKLRYATKQQDLTKSIDYLDIDTSHLLVKTENMFILTHNFIKNLKDIAIYLNVRYNEKSGDKFYTFGDELVCLNILNQLISLGIKSVTLYISPASSAYIGEEKTLYWFERCYYQHPKKVVLTKLSHLFAGINPNLPLPQTISKDNCSINIRFIDELIDASAVSWHQQIKQYIEAMQTKFNMQYNSRKFFARIITENLCLVFYQAGFLANTENINNSITIKPFAWNTELESISCGKGEKRQLNNPRYSVLKRPKTMLPIEYTGKNAHQDWMFDLLVVNKSVTEAKILATVISLIAKNTTNSKIHHGTVYGIHHDALQNNPATILSSWVKLANALFAKNTKPVVVSVIANTLVIDKQQFNNEHTIIIDLEKANDYFIINNLNLCIAEKKVIVLFFPAIPSLVFNYLIDNTTIPILVEGANLTSYALQTAKPFLSVLPTGFTPIPTKMGDPWMAFLTEALSYKLSYNQEYLDHLFILYDYVIKFQYKQAIGYIKRLREKRNCNADDSHEPKFLWKHIFTSADETTEITLVSLLQKGDQLSVIGRKYLLQALNPNFNSILEYIENCTQQESKENHHAQLMQHHVNLAINDKLVVSLNKFINTYNS